MYTKYKHDQDRLLKLHLARHSLFLDFLGFPCGDAFQNTANTKWRMVIWYWCGTPPIQSSNVDVKEVNINGDLSGQALPVWAMVFSIKTLDYVKYL